MQLKIMVWNLEDFFIPFNENERLNLLNSTGPNFDKEYSETTSASSNLKPLAKIQQIKEVIHYHRPDICMFTEVGGSVSLDNFNELFLNNQFQTLTTPSNSDRGIDCSYFVTKNFLKQFKVSLSSNIKHPLINEDPKIQMFFSRDVLELKIDKLELHLFLVHLKSHYQKDPSDPYGQHQRKRECDTLIQIYNNSKSKYKLVAGDFNGDASKHSFTVEFESIHLKSDLVNFLEKIDTPVTEHFTHTYFKTYFDANKSILDYAFMNPPLAERLVKNESYIDHYKSSLKDQSFNIPPKNLDEKRRLPSDHYPLILTVDL